MILICVQLAGCGAGEKPASQMREPEPEVDVLIIGAGIAGLTAALQVARSGLRVLVVDSNSVFGGHAIMAGGMMIVDTPLQREQGVEDSPALALRDLVEWGGDVNRDWARYYVEHSDSAIYDWLAGLGVEFDALVQMAGNSVPRFHVAAGQGLALVSAIYRAAFEYRNVDWRWHTRADELVVRDGRVAGVRLTELRSGRETTIHSRAVLIATGGFQSDLDRVRAHWPAAWPAPSRLLSGSGWHSTGSGLDLARQAGAAVDRLDHQWNYVTGVPDPFEANPDRGMRVLIIPYPSPSYVWINDHGERFANECLSPKDALPAVLDQPGQSYWLVFDDRARAGFVIGKPGWPPDRLARAFFANEAIVKSADDLTELASLIGVKPDVMTGSIERYNRAAASGVDPDFGRFDQAVTELAGCNRPVPLAQPPFHAIRNFPLTRKSMGGISIDLRAQAVAESGQPIPGLYAAGEVTGLAGINGRAALEGTFLGPSVVTAQVAAASIIADLGSGQAADIAFRDTDPAPVFPGDYGETGCLGCHDIDSAVRLGREGYRHFETVHSIIREQGMDCVRCHAGMSPFVPGSHRLDRSALVDRCGDCHSQGN